MLDRRRAYLSFQSLLALVLVLFFLYQRHTVDGWTVKLALLSVVLAASVAFLAGAPLEMLSTIWVQAGVFLGDAVLASLTLHWTQKPHSDLYLIYFLIIFGTAMTRSLAQSFLVALVASVFYLLSAWDPALGLPLETSFWLRIPFLWIMASLAAILSQDSKRAQREQERRYQERLLQMERLAALGQLAGEVAHRIKGPLTTILVDADVLSRRYGKSKGMLNELDQIREEVGRCKDTLKDLLNLGRIEDMDFGLLDLREPVRSALKSVEPQLARNGIRLEVSGLETPAMVLGDQALLHEAVFAVIQNAVEAMPDGGKVQVTLESIRRGSWWSEPGDVRDTFDVAIQDAGKGIAPRNLERIFHPFFTTKGKQGSGLGLSAALRILQNHSGFIEVVSDGPGRGARFTFTVPSFKRR